MSLELNLYFQDTANVVVELEGERTAPLPFASPVTDKDRKAIAWYLETYAASYTSDVDDQAASQTEADLKRWGEALFQAVFQDGAARELFLEFRNTAEPGRLLTISASHPAILSLPWELLRDKGVFLFNENPRISIRRNLAGARGGRRSMRVTAKDRLRLLFVVSRPVNAGFLDPRLEAAAVMAGLDEAAQGRVDVEFLRPATLDMLVDRLENRDLPPVDILHFDGHGAYDPDGRLHDEANKTVLPPQLADLKQADAEKGNMGYLLFENKDGQKALISADVLGEMLQRQAVSLVVLSACQSAAMGGDDALGSVAARLTNTGIPAVIAMTHSVLHRTTQMLFARFYEDVVKGKGAGEALDNARRVLFRHPERGERQRGEQRITLTLYDWFLPALYQAGNDAPLLAGRGDGRGVQLNARTDAPIKRGHNLPAMQEAGFFGRSRELWQIEQAFVKGARRFSLAGFGGQGKTYLAIEAGHWLQRTGMFERVCFVDYAAFQGVDAVGLAVSTLATVLEENLLDAAAATAALQRIPTLVILDNLETLTHPQQEPTPDPSQEGNTSSSLPNSDSPPGRGRGGSFHSGGGQGWVNPLHDLLSAAKAWSEAGRSRVLLTSRMPDLRHPDYRTEGTLMHQTLQLKGLAQEDALSYFQSLLKLPPPPQFQPPERKVLLELFALVDFHPLSIGLLARQLKTRRPAELGQRLETLAAETPDNPLLASLNLSLDRLDADARRYLPRLGVFQGGTLEANIPEITEFSETQWNTLRPALESTGLLQPELLPGLSVPFLKFHPTLAPALWPKLTTEEQHALLARHGQRYYQLCGYLYNEDTPHPHQARATALRELPNLLFAVHRALSAETDFAVQFVNNVNKFLDFFGLTRDRAALSQRAQALSGAVGSPAWYLARSNHGEQLFSAGNLQQAAQVFGEILAGLGAQPTYERCLTLGRLGRCFESGGRPDQAAECHRQGIAILAQLEQSDSVKRQTGAMHTELADVLRDLGQYAPAREAYEKSLVFKKEVGDLRGEAVSQGQLGTLAMLEGDLPEAERRYKEALTTFQRLNEPAMEAVAWHQLGMLYRRAEQWDAAEHAYRESARIKEAQGDLAAAARTWNNLAVVTKNAGKLTEAEGWYRKALAGAKATGDTVQTAQSLSNLADLLQNQPNRLNEARQLAEEGLAIDQTLDPAAAEIWTTYTILAKIAGKQQRPADAQNYRRLARAARANFAGTQHELQKRAPLIAAVVQATTDADVRQQLEPALDNMAKHGWTNLVAAIRRVLAGERNEDALCSALDSEDAMIILSILQGCNSRNADYKDILQVG